jgi:FtsP/CotA-like multicopper oxidase with cupredoxin domain
MRNERTSKTGRAVPILIALAMMAGSSLAQTVVDGSTVYNLRAGTTTLTMPDGQPVAMWGFGLVGSPITVPGPPLTVQPGTSLTINLTNDLPASTPVSVIIPGQAMPVSAPGAAPQVARNPDGRLRSFTHETAAGTTVSYVWSSIKPGTYLYLSGTHPAVQVQMGLYGSVKQEIAAGSEAYPGVTYDQEITLLYSEIDPVLHAAVDAGTYGTTPSSTINYDPKYFLVNGKPYPDAVPLPAVNQGETVHIRLLNAGLQSHTPLFQGTHVRVVAEDGNLYPYAKERYAVLLAAGKTLDVSLTASAVGSYPIYDRMLNLTNPGGVAGGLLTYLNVEP